MPKLKKKHKVDLPYWPSEKFMTESLKMAKDKGAVGTDSEIRDRITVAYRHRRAEILAEIAVPK